MKAAMACSLAAFLACAVGLQAQDAPPQAKPGKEHEWLKQLVGDWQGDMGDAVSKSRMLGNLWMVSEVKAKFGPASMDAIMTLGYDPQKKKFVGSWVDSMQSNMWTYEGTLDATGKILALETEGPNPAAGGKLSKMRDTISIKDKDSFSLSSSMLGEDGKWTEFMTLNYKRKK